MKAFHGDKNLVFIFNELASPMELDWNNVNLPVSSVTNQRERYRGITGICHSVIVSRCMIRPFLDFEKKTTDEPVFVSTEHGRLDRHAFKHDADRTDPVLFHGIPRRPAGFLASGRAQL